MATDDQHDRDQHDHVREGELADAPWPPVGNRCTVTVGPPHTSVPDSVE